LFLGVLLGSLTSSAGGIINACVDVLLDIEGRRAGVADMGYEYGARRCMCLSISASLTHAISHFIANDEPADMVEGTREQRQRAEVCLVPSISALVVGSLSIYHRLIAGIP
jgi:hypothetical protein